MAKRKNISPARARDKPTERRDASNGAINWFLTKDARETLCVPGYTRLSDCPEVRMAANWIADRVSSMTIKYMENTEKGDMRIRDELARMVDITPNEYQTRKTFVSFIIRTLLLEGDGNAVVIPHTHNGYLEAMEPVPASRVSFVDEPKGGYSIYVNGVRFSPDEVLHCVFNPSPDRPYIGEGVRLSLRDVTATLRQASATRKGFMADKWKPSVVIRVADFPDMSPEGRKKILEEFIEPTESGEPWIVPTDVMNIETIKPLSLTDLAINDSIELDRKSVAAIFGVPLYAVGAGNFSKEEYNNALRTTGMHFAQIIQQEFTRKILYSPNRYFKLSARSLYAYDIKELASIGDNLASHGLMTGNEVRDWIDLSPMDGLDELKALENYIPLELIGAQKKLKGGETDDE